MAGRALACRPRQRRVKRDRGRRRDHTFLSAAVRTRGEEPAAIPGRPAQRREAAQRPTSGLRAVLERCGAGRLRKKKRKIRGKRNGKADHNHARRRDRDVLASTIGKFLRTRRRVAHEAGAVPAQHRPGRYSARQSCRLRARDNFRRRSRPRSRRLGGV